MMINRKTNFFRRLKAYAMLMLFAFVAEFTYSKDFPEASLDIKGFGENKIRDGVDLRLMELVRLRGYGYSKKAVSQGDVLELLGRPTEGGSNDNWFYVFNLAQSKTHDIACQFVVTFKEGDLASSGWRRYQCSNLFAEAVDKLPDEKEINVSFDFDAYKVTRNEQESLLVFLEQVDELFLEPEYMITGFTDNLGSKEYNVKLSQRRAKSVRDEFLQLGVSESALSVFAGGASQFLVECDDSSKPELIKCNAPNRRVSVKAYR